MKQNHINQKVQEFINGKKHSTGKVIIKSVEGSYGDTPEEPDTPETPTTPTTPGREYEDPGHEHIYQPPTDKTSLSAPIRRIFGKMKL